MIKLGRYNNLKVSRVAEFGLYLTDGTTQPDGKLHEVLLPAKYVPDDIRPGDLLFFAGRKGGKTVGHVAIATSVDENGTVNFIHASTTGGIRHDCYPDGGYYSRRFIGARRVLN